MFMFFMMLVMLVKRGAGAVVLTAFVVASVGCGAKEEPPAPNPPAGVAKDANGVERVNGGQTDPPDDAELIERFAGTYARESYGHRVMVVRPDGTATMTVDVDPWYQALVGKRIVVEIAWELTAGTGDEDRGVHFESVSGTPPGSFETITKLFGTEADWTIESADDEKLVLYDPEDDETVEWVRVKGDAAAGSLPEP